MAPVLTRTQPRPRWYPLERDLIGDDTNHRLTTALRWTVAALITLPNAVLIHLAATWTSCVLSTR